MLPIDTGGGGGASSFAALTGDATDNASIVATLAPLESVTSTAGSGTLTPTAGTNPSYPTLDTVLTGNVAPTLPTATAGQGWKQVFHGDTVDRTVTYSGAVFSAQRGANLGSNLWTVPANSVVLTFMQKDASGWVLYGEPQADVALAATVGTYASPDTTGGALTLTSAVTEVWSNTTTTYVLPPVASSAGKAVIFYEVGTDVITIDPNASEVIVRDGTAQTGGVTMTLATGAGNYVCLVCDGGRWVTLGFKGVLAAGT